MPTAEDFACPNCGAPLTVQTEGPTLRCPFCSTSVVIPEVLRLRPTPPPPAPAAPQYSNIPNTETVAGRARRVRVRPRRSGAGGLGCLLVLALLGGGAVWLAQQSWARPLVAQVAALAGADTPVPPVQRPLSAGLPRTTRYGGLEFTITQAVMDNEDQSGGGGRYRGDALFARLAVSVRNTTTESAYPDASLFRLRLASGHDYPNRSYDFRAADPGSTTEAALVFEVPSGAQWDGATLLLSAGGDEPAELPLTGPVPPPAYPVALRLPAPAEVAGPAQGLTYALLGATLDLDAGTRRAQAGQRFLKLHLRLTNTGVTYGIAMGPSFFRLSVDDVPLAPLTAPIAVIDYQAALEGDVVFAIPAQAASAELQLGDVTAEKTQFARVPLDLKRP